MENEISVLIGLAVVAGVIYFYKKASGNTYNEAKNYINKVDMGHFNFILNFHF